MIFTSLARSTRVIVLAPSILLVLVVLGCVDDRTDSINPRPGTNMEVEADPHEETTIQEMPEQGPMLGESVGAGQDQD